ncbi:MAG: 50S ribosomal protein L2 [Candidatus Zixiibacteriota bacterium]
MGTKRYKPTTPTQRYREINSYEELTRSKPEKSLLRKHTKTGGRNADGRITVRGRSGGNKRRYRVIDFKRDKHDIPARVVSIEYDPNRTAFISLVHYADGEKRYILATQKSKVGDEIIAGENAPFKNGCALPLRAIPLGTRVHNIEMQPKGGGKIVRAAGQSAQIVGREKGFVILRLPSREIRMFPGDCFATIGIISNPDNSNITYGKAGARRWIGRSPKVRGMAMNPIDHPHGGGEGRNKGYKRPTSPTGVPSKGYKTRNPKKKSNRHILKNRKSK